MGEDSGHVGFGTFRDSRHQFQLLSSDGSWTTYRYLFGDVVSTAIFIGETHCRTPADADPNLQMDSKIEIEDMLRALHHRLVCPSTLLSQVEQSVSRMEPLDGTMKAISFISVVYKLLPDATIPVTVFNKPLRKAK